MVKREADIEEVATRAPALTQLVPKRYGYQPVGVFFRMDTDGRRNILCNTGVHQRDALGPTLFCIPVGTILREFCLDISPDTV